jgi:hypothetical protein
VTQNQLCSFLIRISGKAVDEEETAEFSLVQQANGSKAFPE